MSVLAIFQTQLTSVMDLLTKAIVVEMEKLFDDCFSSSAEFRLEMCSQNQTPNSTFMDCEFWTDQILSIMEILTKEAMEKINKLVQQSPAMIHLELTQSEIKGRAESSAKRPSFSARVQRGHGFRRAEVSEERPPTTSLCRDGEETTPPQSAIMSDKSTEMGGEEPESPVMKEGRIGEDVPDVQEPLAFSEENAVKSSIDAGETFSNECTGQHTEDRDVQPPPSKSQEEC
ncbi:hypothetical protein SKAU_G00160860 [Synaphobranchus kaupii]|uniref:Uncharacterized protein n=1 Tax=Synaphobranchus kaupii TaxID=118154 RepID=A0A9Q1FIM0_SYNKA|nr:hypothetical protein SKAU_G00160860 [Synaphobranchus kaupii]